MNKSKWKIFGVLWTLLTIFSLCLVFIFNHQVYVNEETMIYENINRVNRYNDMNFGNRVPLFFDANAYVVHFDYEHNISKIESFTTNGLSNEEIIFLANKYMNGKSKNENLYLDKYIYSVSGDKLVLFDISETRSLLLRCLNFSILIFLLFELVNTYISYKLTGWIIKPIAETFEKQKQFVYDISHELKTPIAVIMTNADMAEKDVDVKWINNIKNESDRMNKLVVSLLDLLVSDDYNEKEKFKVSNVSKTIEMCVLTFESLIYENNLKVEYDIQSDIKFNCNVERIKQLFGILVDNAIKHAKENSKIFITLKKNKDGIIFSVKNRGDAIPKEEREKIFERFYRSDKSRNRNENRYGLGLAIAKNIVNMHNGKINVTCSGGYTTFTCTFKI